MQKQTPSSSPAEQAERQQNETLAQKARRVIGDYQRDVHEDHLWTDIAINTAINESLSRHESVPVLKIYDYNADQVRAQATRIMATAESEGRPLTEAEKREVIAAQLRVTVLEAISGALDTYLGIVERYEQYKANGMRPDAELETIVERHLLLVVNAAEKRSQLAEQIFLKKIDTKTAQAEALAVDRQLLELLAADDPSIPGGNENGVLPAYSLILSMLKNEYNDTLKKFTETPNTAVVRKRVEEVQALLKEAFPGKKETDITEEEAQTVLQRIDPSYSLKSYRDDLLALKADTSRFEEIKKLGKVNVEALAGLNAEMGNYQVHRSTLATIRHHFDQGYKGRTAEKPFPGQTSDAAMNASRAFLEGEQTGSIGALERHLQLVDSGVLKVGFNEKVEKLWNENGRIWVTRIADQLTTLETSWIPDLPFEKKGTRAAASKEFLMSGLYDALGWPRDTDGKPYPWDKLSKSDQAFIQEKQQSIEKAINTFRESGVLEKLQGSVSAAKILINRTDLHAENFMQAGEIDPATLPTETVTNENIDELVRRFGPQKVTMMCFVQLQQNWDNYSAQYKTLLTDFHESIGAHYDFSRMMQNFSRNQAGIAALLAGLGLTGWIFVAVGGAAAAYTMFKYGGRATWSLAKGGVKAIGKTVRGGVSLTKKAAPVVKSTAKATGKALGDATKKGAELLKPTVKTAKTVEQIAETFSTYEELSNAIKTARSSNNGKALLRLLQHPLLKEAAKAGNREARGLLRLARLMKTAKWVKIGLPILMSLVDVVLLGLNEMDIADAQKEGNLGLEQTLKTKRQVLGAEAAAGGGMLVFSSSIPVALPAVLAGGLYANSILDSVAEWDRSSVDWMQEEPEVLLKKLQSMPYGSTTIGHRTGLGDSPLYRIWKNIAWSRKGIEEEDNRKMQAVEAINQQMRQEILTAYFLKTMRLTVIPNEPEAALKERISTAVQDRLQFVRHLTSNTFDMSMYAERFYNMANEYGELKAMKREFQENERPILHYDWNGGKRTLDLTPLDSVLQSESTSEDRKPLYQVFQQYETEVLPLQEAIRDLQAMPDGEE